MMPLPLVRLPCSGPPALAFPGMWFAPTVWLSRIGAVISSTQRRRAPNPLRMNNLPKAGVRHVRRGG